MTNLTFKAENQILTRTDNLNNVTDTQKDLTCTFNLSTEWNNLNKYIIYTTKDNKNYQATYNNTNTIPWEVLTEDHFYISIYGLKTDDTDYRLTTNSVRVTLIKSGYTKDISSTTTPSKDIYASIFEEIYNRYDNVVKDNNYLVFYSEGIEKKRINISSTETDPVFTSSVAYNITQSNINNWNNKEDTGELTINGTTYEVITTQSGTGTTGKITFITE